MKTVRILTALLALASISLLVVRCNGRTSQKSILLDTLQPPQAFDHFLKHRASSSCEEIAPLRCRVLANRNISYSCPADNNVQQTRYIAEQLDAWDDYCVDRKEAEPDDNVLVMQGNFICLVADCAKIVKSSMDMQYTDLYFLGVCPCSDDIPRKDPRRIWNVPCCTHAYTIKCSAVKKLRGKINICSTMTFEEQLGYLGNTFTHDYMSTKEFTVNETLVNDIEIGLFGFTSFEPQSFRTGMISQLRREEISQADYSCPQSVDPRTKLVWDETQGCLPREICGKVNLLDIPNFNKFFPASILCDKERTGVRRLYDRAATRECLRGKRLCMLGDSTLEETMHDILVLLSGYGTNGAKLSKHYIQMQNLGVPLNDTMDDLQVQYKATGTR